LSSRSGTGRDSAEKRSIRVDTRMKGTLDSQSSSRGSVETRELREVFATCEIRISLSTMLRALPALLLDIVQLREIVPASIHPSE